MSIFPLVGDRGNRKLADHEILFVLKLIISTWSSNSIIEGMLFTLTLRNLVNTSKVLPGTNYCCIKSESFSNVIIHIWRLTFSAPRIERYITLQNYYVFHCYRWELLKREICSVTLLYMDDEINWTSKLYYNDRGFSFTPAISRYMSAAVPCMLRNWMCADAGRK